MTSNTKKVNALLINIARLEQKLSIASLTFEQECMILDRIDTLARRIDALVDC